MQCFIIVILAAATQASAFLFNANARGVGGGATGLLGNAMSATSIIPGASIVKNLAVPNVVTGQPAAGSNAGTNSKGVLPNDVNEIKRMQRVTSDLSTLLTIGQAAVEKASSSSLSTDYAQLKAIQSYGNQLKSFLNVASLILSGEFKDVFALPRAILEGFDIQTLLSMATHLTDIVQVVQQFVTELAQMQANQNMNAADQVIVRLLALDDAKIKKILDFLYPVAIYSNAALSVLNDKVYNDASSSSLSAAEVAEYKRLLAVGYPLSTLAGLTRDVMETALRAKANYDTKSLRIVVDKLLAFYDASLLELLDFILPLTSLVQLVPSIILNLAQNVAGGFVNQMTNFVPFMSLAGK